MPWLLASPGQQRPLYWLCSINRSLSSVIFYFIYLHHVNVDKLFWCFLNNILHMRGSWGIRYSHWWYKCSSLWCVRHQDWQQQDKGHHTGCFTITGQRGWWGWVGGWRWMAGWWVGWVDGGGGECGWWWKAVKIISSYIKGMIFLFQTYISKDISKQFTNQSKVVWPVLQILMTYIPYIHIYILCRNMSLPLFINQ